MTHHASVGLRWQRRSVLDRKMFEEMHVLEKHLNIELLDIEPYVDVPAIYGIAWMPADFCLLFRAVHTNFNAKFTRECLKLSVLKNDWLSQRLGGRTFDIVFKYERPETVT